MVVEINWHSKFVKLAIGLTFVKKEHLTLIYAENECENRVIKRRNAVAGTEGKGERRRNDKMIETRAPVGQRIIVVTFRLSSCYEEIIRFDRARSVQSSKCIVQKFCNARRSSDLDVRRRERGRRKRARECTRVHTSEFAVVGSRSAERYLAGISINSRFIRLARELRNWKGSTKRLSEINESEPKDHDSLVVFVGQ